METLHSKKYIWFVLGLAAVAAVLLSYFVFKHESIDEIVLVDRINTAGESFNNGNVDLSIAELEDLLTKNISDTYRMDVLVALASAYAQKGSLEFKEMEYGNLAIMAVNQALVIDANNSNAYRVMAYAYEIMQDYEKAIPAYEKSVALDSNNAVAYSGLGHAYDLMGDVVKAEANYNKALTIDSKLDFASYNLAKLLYRLGKTDAAIARANDVIKTSANHRFVAEANLMMGLHHASQEKFAEAVAALTDANEADPRLANVYVALADVKMTEISPGVAGVATYIQKKDLVLAEAIQLADTALTINPNLTSAYLTKAKALFFSGKIQESVAVLNSGKSVVQNDITLGVNEKKTLKGIIDMTIITYSQSLTVN